MLRILQSLVFVLLAVNPQSTLTITVYYFHITNSTCATPYLLWTTYQCIYIYTIYFIKFRLFSMITQCLQMKGTQEMIYLPNTCICLLFLALTFSSLYRRISNLFMAFHAGCRRDKRLSRRLVMDKFYFSYLKYHARKQGSSVTKI